MTVLGLIYLESAISLLCQLKARIKVKPYIIEITCLIHNLYLLNDVNQK